MTQRSQSFCALLYAVLLAVCAQVPARAAQAPVQQIVNGGTGCTTAACALAAIGGTERGVNHTITDIEGLIVPLSLSQGGSAATTAAGARANYHAAEYPNNYDIQQLNGLKSYTIIDDTSDTTPGDFTYASISNTSHFTAEDVYSTPFPQNPRVEFFTDMNRVLLDNEPGFHGMGMEGYAVYGWNNNTYQTGPSNIFSRHNMVGFFSVNYGVRNGSFSWNWNAAFSDRRYADPNGNRANDITAAATGVLMENDCGIHNTGSVCNGVAELMEGYAQPVGAQGFGVFAGSELAQWTQALNINAAAIQKGNDAIIVGAVDTPIYTDITGTHNILGTGSSSNDIAFGVFDAGATLDNPNVNNSQAIVNNGTLGCTTGTNLIYTVHGGTLPPGATPAKLVGSASGGVITSLTSTLGWDPGIYTTAPPSVASLDGTGCTGSVPSFSASWVPRAHYIKMSALAAGVNTSLLFKDNVTGAGVGFGFNPGNMFITPTSSGSGTVNIVLSPAGTGRVVIPNLGQGGIITTDNFSNLTSINSVSAASVPAHFAPESYITVGIGGLNYRIPATQISW